MGDFDDKEVTTQSRPGSFCSLCMRSGRSYMVFSSEVRSTPLCEGTSVDRTGDYPIEALILSSLSEPKLPNVGAEINSLLSAGG